VCVVLTVCNQNLITYTTNNVDLFIGFSHFIPLVCQNIIVSPVDVSLIMNVLSL